MLHKPGIMAVAAFLRMQALSARATVGRASGPVTGTVIDTASDPVAGAVAGIARALSPGQLPVWLRALSAGTIGFGHCRQGNCRSDSRDNLRVSFRTALFCLTLSAPCSCR